MESFLAYLWYVGVAFGYFLVYFFVSIILLFLNRKWRDKEGRCIYRLVLERLSYAVAPLDDPIEIDDLENDNGLGFVLIVFGPLCIILAFALAIIEVGCASIFLGVIVFPRWIINWAIRRKN